MSWYHNQFNQLFWEYYHGLGGEVGSFATREERGHLQLSTSSNSFAPSNRSSSYIISKCACQPTTCGRALLLITSLFFLFCNIDSFHAQMLHLYLQVSCWALRASPPEWTWRQDQQASEELGFQFQRRGKRSRYEPWSKLQTSYVGMALPLPRHLSRFRLDDHPLNPPK